MRKLLIIALCICCIQSSQAQFLTQSADGKSSIPLPLKGLGVGIDITKAEVAIGLNNYGKVLKDKSKMLLGLNLTVKNEDGLSNFFSGGDMVPKGDFLGFIGFSYSNNDSILAKYKRDPSYVKHMENIAARQKLFTALKEEIAAKIKKTAIDQHISCIEEDELDGLLKKVKQSEEIADLDNAVYNFKVENDECKAELLAFKKANRTAYKDLRDKFKEDFNKLRAEDVASPDFENFLKKLTPFRITGFLQGGINARSFTRFTGLSTPDLSNSFKDTLFRGGMIGLGMNLQVCNFWLGATYSFVGGDNFENLKSKEYTLRNSDTSGNQVLLREKKITAYSGDYSKVKTNILNIDLLGDFRLTDTSRLLASLYLKSLHSKDTAYLKSYLNIGGGLYFVNKKGKFLGGLYVELPDVNDKLERSKPAGEINIRPAIRKLTFGIVTKFNISSIFAWANRPAKPD